MMHFKLEQKLRRLCTRVAIKGKINDGLLQQIMATAENIKDERKQMRRS